jgi:cytoskeletal protein CcmA (bactofilin family)
VERTPIGNAGTELIVGPNSRFNGNVVISKDINVAGQFKLNSKFTATSASIAQLETGNVSMSGLTVSGDGTINNLAVQGNMNVRGLTQMQGPVTMAQLLTVNNNVNVAGSLAVGGALAVNSLQINSLTTSGTVTIGGKITTRGNAPSVSPGNALGANGTVSISGNDTAGTVGFNAGTGAGGGIIANVVFRVPYSGTPRVIVSPVGAGVAGAYITRSATGFTIGIDGSVPPGGYGFDYLVIQ